MAYKKNTVPVMILRVRENVLSKKGENITNTAKAM